MGGSSGNAAHLGISGFKSWFAGHEVHLMFVALVSINYLLCRFTHCHILWVSLLNYGFTMTPLQRQQVQPHSLPYHEPLVCEHIWLICSLVLAVDWVFEDVGGISTIFSVQNCPKDLYSQWVLAKVVDLSFIVSLLFTTSDCKSEHSV